MGVGAGRIRNKVMDHVNRSGFGPSGPCCKSEFMVRLRASRVVGK